MNLRKQKTCSQKTIRYWLMKIKAIQIDVEMYHIFELKESILWKLLYYSEQRFNSISMKLPMAFFRIWTKSFYNLYGNTKDPDYQSNHEKEKWKWRNWTPWLQTMLQSFNNQDSMLAQKSDTQIRGAKREPRNFPRCPVAKTPNAGGWRPSPSQGIRLHMPQLRVHMPCN